VGLELFTDYIWLGGPMAVAVEIQ